MTRPILALVIGILMSSPFSSHAQTPDPGPAGASAAFTTDDPIVKQARDLMDQGKFKEAQSLLASDDGHADAKVEAARDEMKEIIRRTKREYSQSADEVLAKVKKDIPDVTKADLEKWTKAGETMSRDVDGQTMYFNREPSNIYRFSPEAKERKAANSKGDKKSDWTLIKHLENVIAEADKTKQVEVLPMHHKITYTLTVNPNVPGAKAGSQLRVWLPFPQEYRQQKNVKMISTDPPVVKIAPTAVDEKTHVTGTPQRTAYFEKSIDDPTQPVTFKEVFEYDSYAHYPVLKYEDVKPLPADWDGAYLGERLPHIAFTPEIKATVAKIIGDETNPLKKIRKIYYWISENVKYHAEEEYTIIPSISVQCISRHKGDCGVQSLLFITMARIAGVPARWQSGWEQKRDGDSMHDWAEAYVEPYGWIVVDQSYGLQKESDNPRVKDFYIGHQDSYRMIFNLDYGCELDPPKKSMRSEPCDFQRGEVEMDGKNLYFDQWKYNMDIQITPDEPK